MSVYNQHLLKYKLYPLSGKKKYEHATMAHCAFNGETIQC